MYTVHRRTVGNCLSCDAQSLTIVTPSLRSCAKDNHYISISPYRRHHHVARTTGNMTTPGRLPQPLRVTPESVARTLQIALFLYRSGD